MLGVLQGHIGGVVSAAFLPGGEQIVTFGRDQTAKVHPATLQSLLNRACERLRSWPGPADVERLCLQTGARDARDD